MCNGQNNTPDLGGLVTVGHKATDADYNTIAVTGGQKEVTLNTNQMPSHSHSVTDPQHSHGVNDPGHNHSNGAFDRLSKVDSQDTIDSGLDNTNSTGTEPNLLNTATIQSRETGITIQNSATGITVNDEGNGEPHENRQPYMVLYKLMKL
jgi:microcystin-dependent protein